MIDPAIDLRNINIDRNRLFTRGRLCLTPGLNILRASILPINTLRLSTIADILARLGLIEQRFGYREVSLNRLRKLQILINID